MWEFIGLVAIILVVVCVINLKACRDAIRKQEKRVDYLGQKVANLEKSLGVVPEKETAPIPPETAGEGFPKAPEIVQEAGSSGKIGHLKAFFIGLPSKWSPYLFAIVMSLLPLAFFWPLMVRMYRRARKLDAKGAPLHLSMLYRCLSVLLAYIMLIGPWGFEQLANADILYQNLRACDWANDNRAVEYGDWGGPGRTGTFTDGYDANGSVTKKTTWDTQGTAYQNDDTKLETVTYEYNLQNRLSKITLAYTDGGDNIEEITEYKYNPSGIRVKSEYEKKVNGGTVDTETKDFLIDAYNHTGYAQVFKETLDDGSITTTSYVIGDDVLAQATNTNAPDYLLYDGHGSTRQLSDSTGSPIANESYSYDAYGVLLGGERSTQTDLLYAGEMYDSVTDAYYLRARYYSPSTGRFNRMDPFGGNNLDPQSLHKYLYAQNNPVNMIDPSGNFGIVGLLTGIAIIGILAGIIGLIIWNRGRQARRGDCGVEVWQKGITLSGSDEWPFFTIDVGHRWLQYDSTSMGWYPTGNIWFSQGVVEQPDPHAILGDGEKLYGTVKSDSYFWRKMKYGSGKGEKCKYTTCADVNSCLQFVGNKYGEWWWSRIYRFAGGNNCRHFVGYAVGNCCLDKK